MVFPSWIPGISPIPSSQGTIGLFTDRDIVFGSNNKTHIFKIGDIILPLQPIVEVRMARNWVTTEIAGSAARAELSGSVVKENMGLTDAIITFTGILLSSGSTITQSLGLQRGDEDESIHWADKLRNIKLLFEEQGSVPIFDWAPGEEPFIPNDVYEQFDTNPEDQRVKELGVSMFEQLGIKNVVLLSFNLVERQGMDRKGYTLRLQQDKPLSYTSLMPTEEGEGEEQPLSAV